MNAQRYIFSALATLIVFSCSVRTVSAQAAIPLQVAPARQELQVDPGQKTAINLRFMNTGSEPVTGFLRVADFIVDNETGTPKLLEGADQPSPRFAASHWVTLPFDSMSIAANGEVNVQATVQVPLDSRPGGRYIAVYFEPATDDVTDKSSEEEKKTAISAKLAALTYFRVAGPVTEKALISTLFAPTFQEHGPLSIQADILNRGDYHITPFGSVTIRNMMGGLVDQKRLKDVNIFPDAGRSFSETLGNKWMIGKYKVTVLAAYGTTGQVVERSIDVIVFPWKLALIILLAFIILIVLIKQGYRRFIYKENMLEDEVAKERKEIDTLKEELHSKRS